MVVVFFAVVVVLVLIWWVSWVQAGAELGTAEIEQLALLRFQSAMQRKYRFQTARMQADLQFKSSMKSDGAFHDVDVPIEDALSLIASHLKHKKHEWIIFAFCRGGRMVKLWCNKGPDGTTVSPSVPTQVLLTTAVSLRCEVLICAHNHPNSVGGRVSLLGPSKQDLISSSFTGNLASSVGLDYLDVVCERGDWLVYSCMTANHPVVFAGMLGELRALNQSTAASRRAARSESKSSSLRWSSRA